MNDGGPAFPCKTDDKHRAFLHSERDGESNMPYKIVEHPGMTLRDYFAKGAMESQLIFEGMEGCDKFLIAAMSYELADAMLEARTIKQNPK